MIDAFSRVVKLGEGLATSGRLSDKAMDRTLSAPVDLRRQAAAPQCPPCPLGRDGSLPPGPPMAPISSNGCDKRPGIALDIISAEEEARLAVLGCHILLEAGEGPAMIFDIGGGSTELVLVEAGGPEASRVPRIL